MKPALMVLFALVASSCSAGDAASARRVRALATVGGRLSPCTDVAGMLLGLLSKLPDPSGPLTDQGKTLSGLVDQGLSTQPISGPQMALAQQLALDVHSLAIRPVGAQVDASVIRGHNQDLRRACGLP